jgi:hypothetical protein
MNSKPHETEVEAGGQASSEDAGVPTPPAEPLPTPPDEVELEEDEDTEEADDNDVFTAPLTGTIEKLPNATDQASLSIGTTLSAPKPNIDPSERRRGVGIPGKADYRSDLNTRSAAAGEVRYVIRYRKRKKKDAHLLRTYSDPEGLFETRAEAEEVAKRMRGQRVKTKDGEVTKIPKFTSVKVEQVGLPSRILTWDKWCELRIQIRKHCSDAGLALSGGDRTPERNEQVSGVRNSSHLTTRTDRWADDYIAGNNRQLMDRVAGEIRAKYGHRGRLEILVHDAGSGVHLHVGGPTDGNN